VQLARQPSRVLNIYSLTLWGCLVALVAVVIGGAYVIVAPDSPRVFGQPEPPSPPGTVRLREEGEAMQRRAERAQREAEAYARSPERRKELASDFKMGFAVSLPLILCLFWLMLTNRRPRDAVLLSLPSLVVAAVLLVA
jgi:hypothetical protein